MGNRFLPGKSVLFALYIIPFKPIKNKKSMPIKTKLEPPTEEELKLTELMQIDLKRDYGLTDNDLEILRKSKNSKNK